MTDLTLILALLLGAAGDEPAGKPAAALQAADADRPPIAASEIKALRDSNIFAPYGTKRKSPPPSVPKPSKSDPAPKPKAPVVTGIFFDAKTKCYLVVVEDRNEGSLKQFKDPKFLKTGDEVVGLRVGPVTAEKATFLKGEIPKELSVGEPLPAGDLKASAPPSEDPEASPPEGEEKVEIKPLDNEEKTKTLEKMKKERGKKNRPSNDDQ
jgi:hypothetical protein